MIPAHQLLDAIADASGDGSVSLPRGVLKVISAELRKIYLAHELVELILRKDRNGEMDDEDIQEIVRAAKNVT